MNVFIGLAVSLTLGAIALVAIPLVRVGGKGYRVTAMLSALLIGIAAFFSYDRISDYPWPGADQAAAAAQIGELQQRLAADPSDPAAWVSLGEERLRQNRYPEARDAFREALARDPAASDELRMAFAEAAIMADPEALTAEAGEIIEQVLERHPEDARALWFGGMVALSRGDNAAASARWRRLLDLSPPEEVRSILEKQIAALEAPQIAPGGTAKDPGIPAMPSISVRVSVAPELATTIANLGQNAALFLIARMPETSGPPLAVVRSAVPGLPADMVIGERDRIGTTNDVTNFDAIQLTARISRSGDAVASGGDLYGELLWQRGSDQVAQLIIDRTIR